MTHTISQYVNDENSENLIKNDKPVHAMKHGNYLKLKDR